MRDEFKPSALPYLCLKAGISKAVRLGRAGAIFFKGLDWLIQEEKTKIRGISGIGRIMSPILSYGLAVLPLKACG